MTVLPLALAFRPLGHDEKKILAGTEAAPATATMNCCITAGTSVSVTIAAIAADTGLHASATPVEVTMRSAIDSGFASGGAA